MKYKNTKKSILVLGDRDSVSPFGVTRDIEDEEVAKNRGIKDLITRKVLVPFTGEVPVKAAINPRQAAWQSDTVGKTQKKVTSTGKVVEYISADMEGVDGISDDPDTVTSLSGQKSVDYIEQGMDASKYKDASQKFDEILDKESGDDADFDDEDTLSENEPERAAIVDVDEEARREHAEVMSKKGKAKEVKFVVEEETELKDARATADETHMVVAGLNDDIAKDESQILVKNGKGSSELKDASAVVTDAVAKGMNEVVQATREDADNGEHVNPEHGKVAEFLSKNFSAKKWSLSKEQDKDFLKEIIKVTGSENIKSLAEQRLTEIERNVSR